MKARRGSRVARRDDGTGEAAARARLEALFARIDRLIPDDLAHVGMEVDRRAARGAARRTAEEAVRRADLAGLVGEARAMARDRLTERWAGGLYRPSWAGALNWGVSTGRAEDRAQVIWALEDAALAAVAEGLVDDRDLALLASDGEAILDMATGGPAEESFAVAVHVAAVARTPWVAVGLVAFLLLLVAPSSLLPGVGEPGALALGTGALVLAGSIAVVVIRRARRTPGGEAEIT